MSEARSCPSCGAALTEAALRGLCPKCLAREAGLEPDRTPFLGSLPRTFGDYELLEELGRGGMGIVYKARQKSLNRTVAVKMLLDGPLTNRATAGRFRSEAEAAAQLRHPNIAAIYEIGEQDGLLFFSMDYVTGVNLAYLARNQPLSVETSVRLVQTIAETIHFAHQRGTIHRDLKPSNIIVDEQGTPHILDFGLAKRVEEHRDFTLTGQSLGSPGFAPPEQVDSKRGSIGVWSDIYGLGAILYYLLTGRPPFAGSSLTDTFYQTLHEAPASPRAINPAVPASLERICLRCLEKDPTKRYLCAADLSIELGKALAHLPEQVEAAVRTRRDQNLFSLHPVALFLVAAGIVGLGSLFVFKFGWQTAPWSAIPAANVGPVKEPAPTNNPALPPLFFTLWKPEYGVCGLAKVNGVVTRGTRPIVWDWGDGTTYQSAFPSQHQYAVDGEYTLTVTAGSPPGEVKTAITTLVITNACGSEVLCTIPDPRGNLEGDTRRTFLDVEEVRLVGSGDSFVFEVQVAGPFPSAAEMTGRQIDIIFYVDADRNINTGQFAGLGNEYNIHVVLNGTGWHPSWIKVTPSSQDDGINVDLKSFRIRPNRTSVSLQFPKAYLPTKAFDIWVDASTQNARGWEPLTRNITARGRVRL